MSQIIVILMVSILLIPLTDLCVTDVYANKFFKIIFYVLALVFIAFLSKVV